MRAISKETTEVASSIMNFQSSSFSNESLFPCFLLMRISHLFFCPFSSLKLKEFRHSPLKDAIISFLQRLSDDCSERMSDKSEYHLPFFQKREVYAHFLTEFKRLYNTTPPSPHYFLTTWKRHCNEIKVRKLSRFTICSTCEQIRSAMKETVLKGGDTSELKSRKRQNLKLVSDERMEFQKNIALD